MNTRTHHRLENDFLVECPYLKAYWEEQLHGMSFASNVVLDYIRPVEPTNEVHNVELDFSAESSQRLKLLTNGSVFLNYVALVSSLAINLSRFSGSNTVVVGSPTPRRMRGGIAKDRSLPIVLELQSNLSFRDLLVDTRQKLLNTYARGTYPVDGLTQARAEYTRSNGTTPFGVSLFMEPLHKAPSGISSDLTINCRLGADGVSGVVSYKRELLRLQNIIHFADYFLNIVDGALAQPTVPIRELPGRTTLPRRTRAVCSTFGSGDNPMSQSIVELFEAQVSKNPGAVAFRFGPERLTYRQLNTRANRLARVLQRSGVTSGSMVGLCLDQSFELVVALLGILKCGAAYVPLSPDEPVSRSNEILNEVPLCALLVQRETDKCFTHAGRKLILDDIERELARANPDKLVINGKRSEVCCILYTSGSTGKPRGTLIPWVAVLNRLTWMWDAYPFLGNDVAVLLKSPTLVGSIWEIFGPLLKGVPTLIVTREELLNPARLWETLVSHDVSYLLTSPTILNRLLDEAARRPEEWRSLRLATSSAEMLPPRVVARWYIHFPRVPLLNLYGLTECSSNITVYDTRQMESSIARVPIGRPISNCEVYVVDTDLNPLPVGAIGELCVSGACLSYGYLKPSEKNTRHFVCTPFKNQLDETLYRTGDLGRVLPDGNLELIGRKDNQVKVRGFRIELGDVEAGLQNHPKVKECVVVPKGEGPVAYRLIACVVADDGVCPNSLQQFLENRLPRHMIPSEFVRLEALPRTLGGKIARWTLPPAGATWPGLPDNYVEPRRLAERVACEVFQEVLGVDRVGINDRLASLNVDSLMMIEAERRLQESFQHAISITDLFRCSTVKDVAELFARGGVPDAAEQRVSDRTSKQRAAYGRMKAIAQLRRNNVNDDCA